MLALQSVGILRIGNTPSMLVVPAAVQLDAHLPAVVMMRHNRRRNQHRRRNTNEQE